MKKILIAMSLALALAACDKEKSRVAYPEQAQSRQSTQSCSTGPGYCCTYGMGFDGKFDYSCGMKVSCPGSQAIEGVETPVRVTYESGKVRDTSTWVTTKVLEDCN